MTAIDKAIKDFHFHCRYEKNLTDKTLNAYSIDLCQFNSFLAAYQDIRSVGDIHKNILRDYLKKISHEAKPKTVKRKVATLKVFFSFLELEDAIVVSPFRKMRVKIILENRLPVVLTLTEVSRLFRHLYGIAAKLPMTSKLRPRQKLFLRDLAIFEMLFATGMRVGELVQLRTTDVDLETGTVRIFGKGRKERILPLCNAKAIRSFSHYRRLFSSQMMRTAYFFISMHERPITEQSVRILVEKHVKNAGITKKVTPHTFRHTVATLLLENGVDIRNIQNLLGHSDITTTQLYAKVNPEAQRELLSHKHPREFV